MLKNISHLLDRWLWSLIIPIVMLIYLITSSFMLSALIPSLKAALPAFRSATWLYQHEGRLPHNGLRAASILVMYLATGIWKAASTATISILALALMAGQFGLKPDMSRVEALLVTMSICISATCVTGLAGIAMAWQARAKIWVHPRILEWCGGEFEQIRHIEAYATRFNHGIFILATSLALPGLVAGAMVLAAMTATGRAIDEATKTVSLVVMLIAFVAYPICVVILYSYLSHRIIAVRPDDCWGPVATPKAAA